MAKYKLPDFQPDLRVIARGTSRNRLTVVFDTASDLDLKRSPRIVMVDMQGVNCITTRVDDLIAEISGVNQIVTGKINLLTQKDDGTTTVHLLADIELNLECEVKAGKNAQLSFPSEVELEYLIRHGVADAFVDASLDMMVIDDPVTVYPERQSQDDVLSRQPWVYNGAPAYEIRSSTKTRSDVRSSAPMSKKMMAFIGVLVVLFFVATLKIIFAAPADSVQAAVNNALTNDPRARDEQIEITRQTLREMGLDPGKNGDLGCLAPQ